MWAPYAEAGWSQLNSKTRREVSWWHSIQCTSTPLLHLDVKLNYHQEDPIANKMNFIGSGIVLMVVELIHTKLRVGVKVHWTAHQQLVSFLHPCLTIIFHQKTISFSDCNPFTQ